MTLLSIRRFAVRVSLRLAARSRTAAGALLILLVACREIVAPEGVRIVSETASLINPAGRVVVHASDMKSWVFYNDQNGTACSGSNCKLVDGPAGQPGGSGSAELAVAATTEGKALILPDYNGIRFDRLTSLRYSTYRQTSDAGNNLAISLQFNVDYDLGDVTTSYQGRIVFEPYMGVGGNVPAGTWQSWDTKVGRWWGTRTTVKVNNATVANTCLQATPCTWSQLLTAFPRVGVHNNYGAVVLKAGSGWTNFRGNVDHLIIGVDSSETTFDFELVAPPEVPATAPDSVPLSWLLPSRVNWTPDSLARPLFSELVVMQFHEGTPTSERSAAVAAAGAEVIGGYPASFGEGFYMLRVPDDSTGKAVRDAVVALEARPSVGIVSPNFVRRDVPTYRRPNDGAGRRPSDWILNADSAFGTDSLWAPSAIRAPHAWGCADGAGVRVAVLDYGLAINSELLGRVLPASVTNPAQASGIGLHGQMVSSVLAASADNGAGVAGIAHGSDLLLLDAASYANGQILFDTSGFVLVGDGVIFSHLQRAREQGVRILNISLGSDRTTLQPPDVLDAERRFISYAIMALTDFGRVPAPLIVLSAGNAGQATHPEWNSYGHFADSLPASTIVVSGASRQKGVRLSTSTGSGKIDLWAPGEGVPVFDVASGFTLQNGSSFAAPLTAGTAALMLQQDTSLTAAGLKQLIVASGSMARGITVGGVGVKPFLDAYAALQLVAQRERTPLCGNRLWSLGGGTLEAQRAPNSPAEALFTVPGDPFDLAYVNVHHGGRRIETAFSNRFVLANGSWSSGSWTGDNERNYSGAFKSSGAYYQDHDDSVSTSVSGQLSGATLNLTVNVSHLRGGLPDRQVPTQVSVTLTKALSELCVREQLDSLSVYQCVETDSSGTEDLLSGFSPAGATTNHLHALDPQGRFVIVALVTLRRVTTFEGSLGPCADSPASYPGTRCRNLVSNTVNSLRSQLIRIELSSGTSFVFAAPSLVDGTLGDEVWWLAINEEASEVILQVGNLNGAGQGICTNGRHAWLTIPSSASVQATAAFTRSVPGTALCTGYLDGTGTAASIKAGPP